jgi:putative mycofactocin binding protein MftB
MIMLDVPRPARYQLIPEVKIRRESFGGILYKYGCADRGALSFVNSVALIELLISGQQQFAGDLNAAIEHRVCSPERKRRLYAALEELVKRGYVVKSAVATTDSSELGAEAREEQAL